MTIPPAANDELEADPLCCGEHSPGVKGEPIKLVCQLCRNSPTYWRGHVTRPASPTNGQEKHP